MSEQAPYAYNNNAAEVGYNLTTGQQQYTPNNTGYTFTTTPGGYQQGGYPSYQQGGGATFDPNSNTNNGMNLTVGGVTVNVPLPDKQAISGMAASAVTAASNYEVPESVKTAVKASVANSVAAVKDAILSREYQVAVSSWLYKGWEVYKQKWWAFSCIYLFGLALPFIPVVRWFAPLLFMPIISGMYIATCNHLKTGNPIRFGHMFHGILFFIPLTIAGIFMAITISVGFFLCFLPGIFLLVTLAFTPYVYIEYYSNGLSVIDSMIMSVRMTARHFFLIALYLIISILFSFAGFLLLGVGALVTFPVATISYAFAVQEIFGLNMAKTTDAECIVGF